MIEVEKKFQPVEEQKEKLLEGATLISEKQVVDVYYDTPSFELAKKNMWLRNRDDSWELKIYLNKDIAEEIIDETEILKRINRENFSQFADFAKEELSILGKILTNRKKYHKEGFILDFDETDFGVNKLDIELQLLDNSTEDEIKEAQEKILRFTSQFGIPEVELPLKPIMYLEKMRPDIFRKIFGADERNNELNKLK